MKYCIDTSALIDLWRYCPVNVFQTLWLKIDELISNGEIKAPDEVLIELSKIEDSLYNWAKTRKELFFCKLDYKTQEETRNVLSDFPNLINPEKDTPDADPFVIALAKFNKATVIAQERGGSLQKPKIPFVCLEYKIKCINYQEFLIEKGWKF